MSGVLQFSYLFHLPRKLDLMHRALGWHDFSDHIQRARARYNVPVLIAHHYSLASMMQFYIPDHPTTYLAKDSGSQFDLWPRYKRAPGLRALFVTDTPRPLPKALSSEFDSCTPVEHFWSLHRGWPENEFWVYLLEQR